jgi:transposase
VARPKLAIDGEKVRKLAAIGCTNKEIADFFGCSADTIQRRFAAFLDKGRATGKMRLRKAQWAAALSGNPALLRDFLAGTKADPSS